MKKVQKNVRFDEVVVKEVKKKAIDLDTTDSELINKYVKEGLKRDNVDID